MLSRVPCLDSRSLLVIYFIYSSVYIVQQSQFPSLSFPHYTLITIKFEKNLKKKKWIYV